MQTKNRKEGGEPGKIYHVRNIPGKENLITCERAKLTCPHFIVNIYLFSCESFMADRTKLDGTTLHYLAAPQVMLSVH